MVSGLWYSVSQETAAVLLELVVFSCVDGVISKRVKSDKSILGEIVLVGCVSVRIIVGSMDVSR